MSKFRHIRGLLFDKDGTLVDFDRTWGPINIEVATYAAAGDPSTRDRLLVAAGYDRATGTTRPGSIFAAAGLDETVAFLSAELGGRVPADLASHMAFLYASGGAHYATAIEGVATALATLKAGGFSLGVATNDTAAGLKASLTKCGLLAEFSFTAGCDSGYGAKPDPAVIHAYCKATGLGLHEVAMVGDSTHDMETARRAGPVLRVAVLSGTGKRADLEPEADVVLNSVCELVTVLPCAAIHGR